MNFITIVKDFMKSIVVFAVLSSFCIHLLPEQRYQKYARLVIGLVYICMLLEAMGQIFGKTISGIAF